MPDPSPHSSYERAHIPIRRPAGRDPFVARIGATLLVGLLGLPIALALKGADGDGAEAAAEQQPIAGSPITGAMVLTDPTATTVTAPATGAPATAAAPTDPAASTATAATAGATAGATAAPTAPAATSPATAAEADEVVDAEVLAATAPAATARDTEAPATSATEAPTTTTEAPTTTEPPCGASYTVAQGDYWIGIADRAGVSTRELLSANDATSDTPIYPGTEICLPQGAQDPGPPSTEAPSTTTSTTTTPTSTTDAPTTTNAPSTTATTNAPTTTVAPTTTKPARTYTADEVKFIIGSVFPAELLEDALAIAWRESNYQPGVRNWCCYGLFQINYAAHKSWLAGMGVTSADQLFDPLLNTQVAYALYQRSGGWGPWGGDPS